MNLKRALMLALTATALLLVVFGCTFGVTIQERLDQLMTDLNSPLRDLVYLNLDPSLSDYDALKASAYWDGVFPDGGTTPEYALTGTAIDDAGDGTATVLATIDGPSSFSGPLAIEFSLVRIGFEWFISSITLDGTLVVPLPPA